MSAVKRQYEMYLETLVDDDVAEQQADYDYYLATRAINNKESEEHEEHCRRVA